MVDRRQTKRLVYISLFLGLAGLMTFYRLLPLGGYATDFGRSEAEALAAFDDAGLWASFPMPDLLLCLTLAWVVRRPDMLPAPVIAVYFFLEDILLLRRRSDQFRGYGFWLEYLLVAGLLLVMFLANRGILMIVMVPQVPLGLSFLHLLGTVLAYPAVVAVSHFVFGLRKPATGEVDALGQRL